MAGFLGKAKNAAIATKLKGDILLLDREIQARQKAFGIDFYDTMTTVEKHKVMGMSDTAIAPSKYHQMDSPLKQIYERTKSEIKAVLEKQEVKQRECDILEVRQQNEVGVAGAEGVGQKANAATQWLSRGAQSTRLLAEIKLCDREVRQIKEQFGVESYEIAANFKLLKKEAQQQLDAPTRVSNKFMKKISTSVRTMSAAAENQLASATGSTAISTTEKDLDACIQLAKNDIEKIERRKQAKQNEINALKAV